MSFKHGTVGTQDQDFSGGRAWAHRRVLQNVSAGPSLIVAGDATVTTVGGDTLVSWVGAAGYVESSEPIDVDALIVAGGGGGGEAGNFPAGGGGAGGMLETSITVNGRVYLNAGLGGDGSRDGTGVPGGDGIDSYVGGDVAVGGGGGGSPTSSVYATGRPGGSGGGGASFGGSKAGGLGTAGQGNSGGAGFEGSSGTTPAGGGGGGRSTAGVAGASLVGGDGGDGLASSITGVSVVYAGGGGGSAQDGTVGAGGAGGGGDGGNKTIGPTDGVDGTGGGGGGHTINGPASRAGNGGHGIVTLRGAFSVSQTSFSVAEIWNETLSAGTLGLSEGDPVTSWTGHNGRLATSEGAGDPVFKENLAGAGLHAVRFNGVDNYFRMDTLASFFEKTGATAGVPEFTAFVVLDAVRTTSGAGNYVWGAGKSTTTNTAVGQTDEVYARVFSRSDANGVYADAGAGVFSPVARSEKEIIIVRASDTAGLDIWLGGDFVTDAGVTLRTDVCTPDQFAIGALVRTAVSNYTPMDLYEIGWHATPLSDEQIAATITELKSKYGF